MMRMREGYLFIINFEKKKIHWMPENSNSPSLWQESSVYNIKFPNYSMIPLIEVILHIITIELPKLEDYKSPKSCMQIHEISTEIFSQPSVSLAHANHTSHFNIYVGLCSCTMIFCSCCAYPNLMFVKGLHFVRKKRRKEGRILF